MVKLPSSGDPHGSGGVRVVDPSDRSDIVLDAAFLFSADFTRLGEDLLLRGADGAEILVRDYFAEVPPPLQTAEGARLAPATVEALAGPAIPLSFAQAGDAPFGASFGAPIGEVSALNGIARVQRADGTRGNLHEGDPVFQGDVVSTGFGSELGILFIDDTVFSLSANARMVLDALVYQPAGTANSMGVSLIQGTFVFVTGKIAPSGEMDVATPVGTIGIRGTTVGVRIAAFSGATRIVNIENPETGETGRFTFSNFGGSTQFTRANHFLEIRSADVIPGTPALIPSEAIGDVFGRPLSSATEIQRSIDQDRTEGTDQQQGEATPEQTAPLSEPPLETAADGDQPLSGGSGFAAGLTLSGDLNAGLVGTGLLPTGPLGGVDISGFGLLISDDRFHFILPEVIEEAPAINVVYLVDISGSMAFASDGSAASPSSPSRLDLAKQTLLALNQQFIDAGAADRVSIKIIAFQADSDTSVIGARSQEFDRADDSGLPAFVDSLVAGGGTQYEGPLRVAADWLREDLDPGDAIVERHEDAVNFIYLFSDGGETYNPDASLVADLYDSGSGMPHISNLTIRSFGFGEPGASNFSADQLGKVEAGSLGHGDQVTIISDIDDIGEIFSTASPTGQSAGEEPESAAVLQLADLVGDAGLDVETQRLLDGPEAGTPAAFATGSGSLESGGLSLAAVQGLPGVDLNAEEFISPAQA